METVTGGSAEFWARMKVIATVYASVSCLALAYGFFTLPSEIPWTFILMAAVGIFVLAGTWFSFKASSTLRPLILSLNIVAFIALAIELALVAPQEQILGSYIRLIYIHAAVTWVGLALFVITFISGLAYLLAPKVFGDNWTNAIFGNALFFWTGSTSIGMVAAYLTWGSGWYTEPRLKMALMIFVLVLVVYLAGPMISFAKHRVALQTGVPVVIFFMLLLTGKLVHPNNAFAKSDSLEMKLFALTIAVVFGGVAVQGVRWLALSNRACSSR